jgi:hypothetical protein
MFEAKEVTLQVVPLANGQFGVRATGSDASDAMLGDFASAREAEAWVLQRSMADEQGVFDTDILKPGDGQGLA